MDLGNGDFGRAWDRNLSDEDGPYIELMCGVYTDNQPDFSWLAPNEEKSFVQYFMPYRDLGLVKNAVKEALLNLEMQGQRAEIKFYTTGIYPKAQVELSAGGKSIFADTYDASPRLSYQKSLNLPEGIKYEDLCLSLKDQEGRILVAWQPEKLKTDTIPDPAKAAKAPEEIASLEQLYLTGLHLEQYRHATYSPVDYYSEALRREPGDIRCNNALGLWLLRRGKFVAAQQYFEKAITTWTERNPNPYDGEAFYNLGLSLQFQDKPGEAYAAFYKATWNAAWQNAAYLHLAQIDAARGDFLTALEQVDKSLARNSNDQRALHLKIALLRRLGNTEPAPLQTGRPERRQSQPYSRPSSRQSRPNNWPNRLWPWTLSFWRVVRAIPAFG
jgi:Tfp pilus assembly protein PilF